MPQMNYDLIRPDIKRALDEYASLHYPVGDFLTAVLSNELVEAFGRADEETCRTLFHIAGYVYNELPRTAWGSREVVTAWLSKRNVKTTGT